MSDKEKIVNEDSKIEEIQNAELPQSSDPESLGTQPYNFMQSTMCYLVQPYNYFSHYNNQFYMMYRNGNNLFNNQHLAYDNFNNYPANDANLYSNDHIVANGNQNLKFNRKNFKHTKKFFHDRNLTQIQNNFKPQNHIKNFPPNFENQNFNDGFSNYQFPPNYYNQTYIVNAQLASNFNNLNLNQNFEPNTNLIENRPVYNQTPNDFKFKGEVEGAKDSRFFVIKSYSAAHVIHGIKNGIWCSTENGNKKLNEAFNECSKKQLGSIYLFFSINGSGHFCGMAEMTSDVDFDTKLDLWAQDKWKGKFSLNWIFVKDIPNRLLKHIILPNNENKPITKSRDTQEVFFDQAVEVVNIFRTYFSISNIIINYESSLQNDPNEHINNIASNSSGEILERSIQTNSKPN